MNNYAHNHIHIIPGHPDQFGPGTWWILHLSAYHVIKKKQINDFVKYVHYIAANIPCMMCRGHAKEYLNENNGSKYIDMEKNGRHIGMFIWMSDFHNTVNKRNNKKIINWEKSFKEYSETHKEWESYKMPKPIV